MNPDTTSHILKTLRDEPGEAVARWLRRAGLQLEFARAFAAILPAEQAGGWGQLIDAAQQRIDGFEPSGGIDVLAAAVQEMEASLHPIGEIAKQYKIHCVGHGHIDMNWMWSWPETVATTHDTFASILSLMRQYPDLTFSQSQASVYALIECYYPAMFEEIKQRVKEGRWEITAAHWVEGDKNIASGESLARHLLYARDYFQKKFGLSPEDLPVDWEPDTFGHAATIPAILAQGAVKYYYSCRQGGGFDHARIGDARPRLFYWQAPDGVRVLVNRESTWYNSYVNIGENIALPLVGFAQETGLRDWLNIYGMGNHGGGPSRAEIDYYHEIQEWPIYPQIVFTTSKHYFDTIARDLESRPDNPLPTLAHELNFEFTGCYTSQSLIKQANRFGENYLEEAETLAVLAARIAGQVVPKEQLREAWLNVLFNQFHDILPGSGVRQTREHAMGLFQEVGAITGSIKRAAGGALTSRINTLALLPDTRAGHAERALVAAGVANTPYVAGAGDGAGLTGHSRATGGGRRFRPYVVYNPCAWARSERISVALYDTDFDPSRIVALDEHGVAHPTLHVGSVTGWKAWGHSVISVAFDAVDVPALGYRTYLLCEGVSEASEAAVRATDGDWFETPFLRFRLDRFQSGLLELIDKRTGAQLVGEGATLGAWVFVCERPRGMTAWILGEELDAPLTLRSSSFEVIGAHTDGGSGALDGAPSLGYRVQSVLSVPGTESTVRLTLMIHALEPRLDFTAELDWREIGDEKRGIPGLTIRFPLALSDIASRYEAPFGSVERALFDGEEVPTLRYAHISGTAKTTGGGQTPAGVTLLQDCKYGHAIHGSELRLRIVRSSFDPDHAPEVAQSVVRYSLFLHDGPADPATLTRLGAAWNHPFLLLPANLQEGNAPATRGFVNVATPNVILSALKQAEDGEGLVLRLVELNGEDTEAIVEIDPLLTSGLENATLLDLMERPLGGAVNWDGTRLRVPIQAYSFVTVRLALE